MLWSPRNRFTLRGRLFENEPAPSDPQNAVTAAIKRVESEVGGNVEDSKALTTSFEAIRAGLDKISIDYFKNPQNQGLAQLYLIFKKADRAKILNAYVKAESKKLAEYLNQFDSIDPIKDPANYLGLSDQILPISGRLGKIASLIDNQEKMITEAEEDSSSDPNESLRSASNIAKKYVEEALKRIRDNQIRAISGVPSDLKGDADLESMRKLLDLIGMAPGVDAELRRKQEKIDRGSGASERRDSGLVKNKLRISNRLIRAIRLARLPAISEGKVEVAGDYYKLFTSLLNQDELDKTSFMTTALENYVFLKDASRLNEFKTRAMKEESALEEDQLNYLAACRSWIQSYLQVKDNGALTKKEEDGQIASLNSTYSEKTKEIKNYYLARDFNLGNFGGLQLKPEIRLPLYTTVKLPVTEADRIKESPLRNLLKATGALITGLFSAIPVQLDQKIAADAAARNRAILAGLSAIVKVGAAAVGGKQLARDYTEKVEKPLLGKKEKGVKEDMLSVTDAPGFIPVNPEAPGQLMQTPDSMVPNNMDALALAGPGKKKKKKTEPQPQPTSQRVMNFSDFLKGAK
jgi:hypothetical protein